MKKWNQRLVLLAIPVLVSLTGCGSSHKLRTSDLTVLQQQYVLDTAQAIIGSSSDSTSSPSSSSSSSPSDSGGSSASYAEDTPMRFSSALMLHDAAKEVTQSIPCDRGSVDMDIVGSGGGTIRVSNCVTYESVSSNPETDFSMDGSIEVQVVTASRISLSYDNITTRRAGRSCSLSGTVDAQVSSPEASTIPLTMTLTSSCGGTNVNVSGSVTLSESGSSIVANGVMTFVVGNAAPHDCELKNYDELMLNCARVAQACRFPESVCAEGTPGTDISAGGGGGSGGAGGSGGSPVPPRLVETNPSQGNFCSFHESLIGEWGVQAYSYYTTPKLKFEPAHLFLANFGGTGVASGTYEIIAADRIRFHVGSTSTLDVLPANANVEGTVRIADGSLQLVFDGSHSYRFPYHYFFGDNLYGDSSLINPYRIDQKCTIEDHHLLELASNPSCTTEIFQGDWYYLLPIFDGRYSADRISFSPRQTTSTGGTPVLFNNLAFDWKVYSYLLDSDPYSLREDYLGLPGNIVVSSDRVEFDFINSESVGMPFGTRKGFSFRSTSPYLSLTGDDGQTIFLGRSYSGNDTQKSRREDGICEGTSISDCPASSLAGGWRLGSYYRTFHAGQPVKFSREIIVPVFDRMAMNTDGTLQVFRNGVAGETFFYQVVEGCYGCTAGQNWSLQIARERSQLPRDSWTSSPTFPKLGMTVTPNSLYLHADGYDDSNYRWSEDLVFEKEEASSPAATSLQCVMRT